MTTAEGKILKRYGIKSLKLLWRFSELVLLEQNIGTSTGDSTSPEVKSLNLSFIEEGVL